MLDHPRERYSDRKKTGKIISEFDRSPIQFLVNMVQLIVLVGGIFLLSFRLGVFRAEFAQLQTKVSDLAATVANGINVQAKENERLAGESEKLKMAIIEHTRKPIP